MEGHAREKLCSLWVIINVNNTNVADALMNCDVSYGESHEEWVMVERETLGEEGKDEAVANNSLQLYLSSRVRLGRSWGRILSL